MSATKNEQKIAKLISEGSIESVLQKFLKLHREYQIGGSADRVLNGILQDYRKIILIESLSVFPEIPFIDIYNLSEENAKLLAQYGFDPSYLIKERDSVERLKINRSLKVVTEVPHMIVMYRTFGDKRTDYHEYTEFYLFVDGQLRRFQEFSIDRGSGQPIFDEFYYDNEGIENHAIGDDFETLSVYDPITNEKIIFNIFVGVSGPRFSYTIGDKYNEKAFENGILEVLEHRNIVAREISAIITNQAQIPLESIIGEYL